MQRLFAIAWLTVKAAIRFRLFYVLGLMLVLTVAVLPAVIKHDGTARGFTQITLTYTLGMATVLLGFVTLWLGCGTLAREVEENQIQMVDVKPVARWQVWLGKWLGIMTLNTALLALSAGSVYALLLWRAQQLATAPVDQRAILFNEVLVARASAREAAPNIEADIEREFQAARQKGFPEGLNETQFRQLLRGKMRAANQTVPPDRFRRWVIDLGPVARQIRDRPLHLRFKYYAAERPPDGLLTLVWEVGPADRPRGRVVTTELGPGSFHELTVPPGLLDEQGRLTVECANRSGVVVIFPLEDGLEVLYREAGFTVNLLRALVVILCWLGLLAAIGLAAAGGLSFPVAAFVSLSLLFMALSSGTLAHSVEQGSLGEANHETGEVARGWVDVVAVPVFKALLKVINLASGFSPVDALSTGRSVGWGEVLRAIAQVSLLLTGAFAAAGIWIFQRRELAASQNRT